MGSLALFSAALLCGRSVEYRGVRYRVYREGGMFRLLKDDVMVQFTVTGLVLIVLLAGLTSAVLSSRLDRQSDLLVQHGAAMMAGAPIKDADRFSIPSLRQDVITTRWITFGIVGGGFFLVYGGLVAIVWRARNTIVTQKGFESLNSELNEQIQGKTAELQRTADQLAEEAAERVRTDHALREMFSAYVRQMTDRKRLEGGDSSHSQELEAMIKMADVLTQPGSFSQKAHRVLAELGHSGPVRSNGASTEN